MLDRRPADRKRDYELSIPCIDWTFQQKARRRMRVQKLSRRVALAAIIAVVAGLYVGPVRATAAEQSRESVVLSTSHGCNGWVCINVYGSGLYVDKVLVYRVGWAPQYTGHHDILLPVSPYRVNGRQAYHIPSLTYYPRTNYPNNSKVCGEGWQYASSTGGYILRGRPCLTIHS